MLTSIKWLAKGYFSGQRKMQLFTTHESYRTCHQIVLVMLCGNINTAVCEKNWRANLEKKWLEKWGQTIKKRHIDTS